MADASDEVAALPSANVRAERYYVARTRTVCPQCRADTALVALALASRHELLDEETQQWQSVPANAMLFHLVAVASAVLSRLRAAAPQWRFDSYWLNSCEHCGHALHDQQVHCEPGCGFTPLSEEAAAAIVLTEIDEPFQALAAGYALEPEFFAHMRRD